MRKPPALPLLSHSASPSAAPWRWSWSCQPRSPCWTLRRWKATSPAVATRLQLYSTSCSFNRTMGAMWWWRGAGRREELQGGSEERGEQRVPLAPLAPLSPPALPPSPSECIADVFILPMREALLDSSGPSSLSSLLPATPLSLYLPALMSPPLCLFGRMWFFTVPLTGSTFPPRSRTPLLSRLAATQTHQQHVLLC